MKPFRQLDKYTPLIMLAPALLGIVFVHIYPSLDSIRMSFFDIQLLKTDRPFIWFDNYLKAISDPSTLRIIINTLFFTIFSLIFGSILAMIVATELNKGYKGRTFFRAIFLAPWVTPPLVTATVWRLLLSESFSPINRFLMDINLIDKPINFLGQTDVYFGFISLPMIMVILINVWSIFPFMMVMFLAGLQTIPVELYEAANVDGAGKWKQFTKITLPSLLPIVETSILLEGIWQFNNFNISYLVTKGGPLNLTEVLAVRVYSEAFTNFKYGYAAAFSVVMLIIVMIPSLYYIKRSLKTDHAT